MRYAKYIQQMTHLDRLQAELRNHLELSKKLTHKWMTYASHRDTGLVYDTQILDEQVEYIRNEIEKVKKELGDDTNN